MIKMNSITTKRFLIIGVLVAFAVGLVSAVEDEEAWNDFKTRYNKSYESKQEEEQRMKVFLDNKLYIESYNTKDTKATFTQGINSLSDLTAEEIMSTRCGFHPVTQQDRPIDGLLHTLLLAINATAEISPPEDLNSTEGKERAWYEDILSPMKLDYRARGKVTKVKDQGSCGSCWAFATTGALESMLLARNKSVLLSEQNLVDCSRSYGNYGCSGGLMDAALDYVRDHGIMSSQDYKYTARDGYCKFKQEKSVTSVRGSVILPRNERLLRLTLALTGPIPVAIDAGPRSFHSYKSGVYNDPSCRSSPESLNHAVLLVGYGSDPVGGDYWIVKNSWGAKWGDSGYIKLARSGKNQCGIASYAVLPIP